MSIRKRIWNLMINNNSNKIDSMMKDDNWLGTIKGFQNIYM